MKSLILTISVFFVLSHSPVFGQGKAVADFKLPDSRGNGDVSLSDYKDKKGVVVIFTGNSCPYDSYYRKRIIDLSHQCLQSGLPFILINAHQGPEESSSKMASVAKTASFGIPYLKDASQTVFRDFGAKKSPEAFLLKNTGGKFTIVYQGAIDDNPQVAADVNENYLLQGIEEFFAGKALGKPYVRPTGCIIRAK